MLIPEDLLRSWQNVGNSNTMMWLHVTAFLDPAKCLATAPRAEWYAWSNEAVEMMCCRLRDIIYQVHLKRKAQYILVKIVKLSSEKDTQQSMSRYTSANCYFSPEVSLFLEAPRVLEIKYTYNPISWSVMYNIHQVSNGGLGIGRKILFWSSSRSCWWCFECEERRIF